MNGASEGLECWTIVTEDPVWICKHKYLSLNTEISLHWHCQLIFLTLYDWRCCCHHHWFTMDLGSKVCTIFMSCCICNSHQQNSDTWRVVAHQKLPDLKLKQWQIRSTRYPAKFFLSTKPKSPNANSYFQTHILEMFLGVITK